MATGNPNYPNNPVQWAKYHDDDELELVLDKKKNLQVKAKMYETVCSIWAPEPETPEPGFVPIPIDPKYLVTPIIASITIVLMCVVLCCACAYKILSVCKPKYTVVRFVSRSNVEDMERELNAY